jgi:tetratricopeptide (TPR) repeat protein
MRHSAKSIFAGLTVALFVSGASARDSVPWPAPEDAPAKQAPQQRPDIEVPQDLSGKAQQDKKDDPAEAKKDAPPQTPGEERADLYAQLAASKDADETAGVIARLMRNYAESGSDTADLLLKRARQAIGIENYADALKILDMTVALAPDWAEGWNARATARYLDDDYNGSMADIAQTLKREPRHIGALMGMGMILEARDKKEAALRIYTRVLEIAPHWKNAETAADKLKAALAGSEL